MLAGAENCVNAIEAIDRRTPRAGIALVARGIRRITEVVTPRALQQVAAGGRHIAQLRRSSRAQRLRQHWVSLLNQLVIGQIAIADHRADLHAATAGAFHPR